jgi:hypothetical protein
MERATVKRFTGQVVMTTDEPFNHQEIDEGIRDLVVDLNRNGYITASSCQGRTKKGDEHTPHAFISFERKLSKAFMHQVESHGLNVYNGCISISTPVYEDTPEDEAVAVNTSFVGVMRRLFGI